MNILFRVDSSSTIGTGHVMRDLVLASQLSKESPHAKILFAAQNLDGNINHKIAEAGYEIIILNAHVKEELLDIVKSRHVDMLAIDHYGIDYEYESFIKENADIKILSFDDTYEKHNCDILLNHNISANSKKYKNLVPKNCELRCGSKYTLLRDEFYQEKKKRKTFKKENSKLNIFLAMGGADHSNINIKILKVLKKFKNIKVNVVTTTANKNLIELEEYVKGKKWIKLHVNSNKIAKLMRKSDFAIITPSVTANEVYFMQVPLMAIKTADNQIDMYKYLKKENFLVLNKFKNKKLKKDIEILLNKDNKHAK